MGWLSFAQLPVLAPETDLLVVRASTVVLDQRLQLVVCAAITVWCTYYFSLKHC